MLSGIALIHFITQLTKVNSASNKPSQLRRIIITEVLDFICLKGVQSSSVGMFRMKSYHALNFSLFLLFLFQLMNTKTPFTTGPMASSTICREQRVETAVETVSVSTSSRNDS